MYCELGKGVIIYYEAKSERQIRIMTGNGREPSKLCNISC